MTARRFMAMAVFLLFTIIIASSAFAWTLVWSRVTSYVDNTPILPSDNIVYDAWQGIVGQPDTLIANGTADNSVQNLNVSRGKTYKFSVRARTVWGETSDNNSITWSWPAGKTGAPGQLKIIYP